MKKKMAVMLTLLMMVNVAGCTRSQNTLNTQETTTGETEVVEENLTEDSSETTEEVFVATEEEKEDEGVLVTYETTEDEKKLDDGSVIMYVSYMKPTVTISGNEEAQNIIQENLDQAESDFYTNAAELEGEARQFYTEMPGEDESAYAYDVTYSDVRADKQVISFMRSQYTYQGGAHGYTYSCGINYDVKTGAILTLDDITTDKEAFLAQVKEVIIEKCDNGEYKEAVFPDYKDYVDGIIADDLWYFDKEGITFIANAYEIGPYASGMLTFTVPYDEILDVKEAYMPE